MFETAGTSSVTKLLAIWLVVSLTLLEMNKSK
jgi:hypothetical protein